MGVLVVLAIVGIVLAIVIKLARTPATNDIVTHVAATYGLPAPATRAPPPAPPPGASKEKS